ncbi:MAG: PLD nuclease N-terminal domain-containing protein [Mobilitalea sp.]
MQILSEYLVFLIPILVIELGLMITALIHVLKHSKFRFGNKILWVVIVLFIQIIGPIAYFVFGREEE